MIKEDSDRLSALRVELRRRIGEMRYELWFGDKTQLTLRGAELCVTASSSAERQWLRRNFGGTVRSVCRDVLGPSGTIDYAVADESAADERRCTPPEKLPRNQGPRQQSRCRQESPQRAASATAPAPPAGSPRAGSASRYTFESFFSCEENRLALHTAQEVARRPGRYSPLLLTGSTGTGKSHLLAAIAEGIRRSPPHRGVLLLTAEQFTCQFLHSLDQRSLPGFRQKCRSVDVLLVDDVQFLAGKKATLEELLNTIDSLQQREGQVVLSCDCGASELGKLSGELQSRVSGGLAIEVQPPDYEARLAIVRRLIQRMGAKLENGVDEMIARQAVGSARLISGAINRLVATSMAVKKPIAVDLAAPVLDEFARQNVPQVRLADIQRAVCQVFGVESSSLKSPQRTRRTSEPRMLAMWLARRYTRAALSEIGDFFGGRSHSTVASAQRKFERLINDNSQLQVDDRPCCVEEALRRVESALRTA